MFVTEHLERATGPLFSYEIIPPARGRGVRDILDVVEQVMRFSPPFIDVTAHASEANYDENPDGTIRRRIQKKRPGTISICGIIQNRYNIDTVAHLLCRGFTREETEDAVIELNYLGIHNVLAIRGDETNYRKPVGEGHTVNVYAAELVEQLQQLRSGRYLGEVVNSEAVPLCIGAAGYPEKHLEAPSFKADMRHLKEKVEAGADYVVTQMFFRNQDYFAFVAACREADITIPILPGLKVLSRKDQLSALPKNFDISLPDELVEEIQASPEHAREIGERWTQGQCQELLNAGVKCIHFYVMNDAASVLRVVEKL
jgi:methylenetetrahydrofolate reductase (NADPH)